MKVLIMNPILYTSETDEIPKVNSIKDTMIYALCMGFMENGDEPVLLAADCYQPVEKENYPFEIIWLPCRLTGLFKPRCLPWLKGLGSYLRKQKTEYDYIISSEVFSMLTLCGALFARKKLIIWHELGAHNNLLHKLPSKFWYHIVARIFMRNIPVIPRSEKASQFISQFCDKVSNEKIDHGVDLQKIVCESEKKSQFVVLSQLIERKHIDGIITHFAEFYKKGNQDYTLQIIGEGELRAELERQSMDCGIAQAVRFTGKLSHEELLPMLNRARALLVNTSKDNSMVSIVESIAAGTPVITTSVPFNAAYIRKNQLGIVKDDWGVQELEEICTNNSFYVQNCIAYREKLSNSYCAKQFNQAGGALSK